MGMAGKAVGKTVGKTAGGGSGAARKARRGRASLGYRARERFAGSVSGFAGLSREGSLPFCCVFSRERWERNWRTRPAGVPAGWFFSAVAGKGKRKGAGGVFG